VCAACLAGKDAFVLAEFAHADYYCIQSQLFRHPTMNVYQQTRLLWRHTKRISDS
jgi:hypothetical protein